MSIGVGTNVGVGSSRRRKIPVVDPESGLVLTDTFSDGDVIIPNSDVWVDEDAIFAIDLSNLPETPDGAILEIGGASRGFAISFGALVAGQLIIRCGSGGGGDTLIAATSKGTDGYPTGNGTLLAQVTGSASKQTSLRALWFDGSVVTEFYSIASGVNGNWAGGASGLVGGADATRPNQYNSSAANFDIDEIRYFRDQNLSI